MTFEVDGAQYVAVLAGWGGVFPLVAGELSEKSGKQRNVNRLLVHKLGGNVSLPTQESGDRALDPPGENVNEGMLRTGHALYANFCSDCHGARAHGGGVIPDLRASGLLWSDAWFDVVLGDAVKSGAWHRSQTCSIIAKPPPSASGLIAVAQADKATGAVAQSP